MCFFQCDDKEFSCNSGSCVSLDKRCDEMEDCSDKSDEINCTLATMHGLLYRKEYPPIDSSGNKTKVYLMVTLSELGSFQEMSMTFKAKVYLQLKWYDKRLTFENLKRDKDDRNSIGKHLTKTSPLQTFFQSNSFF